jgi:hypothetical protein
MTHGPCNEHGTLLRVRSGGYGPASRKQKSAPVDRTCLCPWSLHRVNDRKRYLATGPAARDPLRPGLLNKPEFVSGFVAESDERRWQRLGAG